MSTLESLKSGAINVSDITVLEQLDTEQLVDELSTYYQIQFLDRRIGKKWEVGLAKDRVDDDFHRCLMLTSEEGHLTTIAVMACLRFHESPSTPGIYEMTSGGGFSLYRTPDGWRVKSLDEKHVSLNRDTLKKRGWLLASE